jgi:serine/threonine protein kinase
VEHAIMGTPAYMAPEQLSAEAVDVRTDLFSFGAVLYEMAAGQRAFPRHLDRTPPPPAKTSPGLQRIITKLLESDRGLRYQSALEVRADLDRLGQPPPRPRKWMAIALAAAALLAVAVALVWPRASFKAPHRSEWVQITNFPDSVSQPALSPDGRVLAFVRGIGTFYTEGLHRHLLGPIIGTSTRLSESTVRLSGPTCICCYGYP